MIGIFDSGIGGLTVVSEMIKQLPGYQLTYFGDTARTPYGNKSESTIIRYAMQDTKFLLDKGAQIIVVACNTASAVAADQLKKEFDTPIFEVITPAVEKALAVTKNKRIGVIGTRATVHSHIYQEKIDALDNKCKVFDKACPLFVPLAEEGWTDKAVTKMTARTYLQSLKMQQIDTLILGCTHYPLLKQTIQAKIGKQVQLIDPAEETAGQIKQYLAENKDLDKTLARNDNHAFYFSDLPPHLASLAHQWLGQAVKPQLQSMA